MADAPRDRPGNQHRLWNSRPASVRPAGNLANGWVYKQFFFFFFIPYAANPKKCGGSGFALFFVRIDSFALHFVVWAAFPPPRPLPPHLPLLAAGPSLLRLLCRLDAGCAAH